MRNLFPLLGIGFVILVILGVIVGGIVMIGYGVGDILKKDDESKPVEQVPKGQPQQPQQPQPPIQKEKRTLTQARAGFETVSRMSTFARSNVAPAEVAGAEVVSYGTNQNEAYVSVVRPKMQKRPAVVWAHGGFGEIGPEDWVQAKPFHDAGFVLMVPSFRGENRNRGRFEMFFGEVDDLLAAVDYVAKLPSVDPSRVYVAGHSSGGTLTLLAAATGTTKVRAFFSIAGAPNVQELMGDTNGRGYEVATAPFDHTRAGESYLRSASPFVNAIRRSTFFFGPRSDKRDARQAEEMERRQTANVFQTFIFPNPNHLSIVDPVVLLICKKIEQDRVGDSTNISFGPADLKDLFPK